MRISWRLLLVLAFLLLVAGLSYWLKSTREEMRRTTAQYQVRRLMIALEHYRPGWQRWPPPVHLDAQGKPAHSWRVMLVPYLMTGEDERDPLGSYRMAEPWDSPHNSTALEGYGTRVPEFFHAPVTDWGADTGYVAVVDPAEPGEIGMILGVQNSGIHWMSPRDLTIDEALEAITATKTDGPRRCHPDGAWAGLRDRTVHWIPSDITPEEFRALLERPRKGGSGTPAN